MITGKYNTGNLQIKYDNIQRHLSCLPGMQKYNRMQVGKNTGLKEQIQKKGFKNLLQ